MTAFILVLLAIAPAAAPADAHARAASHGRWHVARPHARGAIVGGVDATQGELDFMAFVEYYDQSSGGLWLCSGTVVAPNVVLTAAHCAVDENTGALLDPAGYAIVTGSVDWTSSGLRQVSGVSRVIVDPAYDASQHDSDAALLVLSTPTTAPSVALASGVDAALERAGTGAVIAGWGETYAGSDTPAILQWADTVLQPPGYCAQFARTYDAGLQLCAVDYPYEDTSTCSGDSGGPLLAADAAGNPVEIGITSYGPANCNTATASYFTTVEPLAAWAQAEIRAVAPPPQPPPPPPPAPAPTPAPSPAPSAPAPTTPAPTTPAPTTPAASPPASPPSPPPALPRLTAADARTYARQTLAGVLGRIFKRRTGYKPSCSRVSATRFNCAFTFRSEANNYHGAVAVFLTGGAGNTVYWSDRYTVHWVSTACASGRGHPGGCRLHTRRGSW